jgi:arsenate reductase
MAEGFGRVVLAWRAEVESAGTQPHGLNPLMVRVMAEMGIDVTGQRSKHIDEFAGVKLDLVVTVCDAAHEACPLLPGARVMHRGFDDPPRLALEAKTEEEALGHYRRVRDEIRAFVEDWRVWLPDRCAENAK